MRQVMEALPIIPVKISRQQDGVVNGRLSRYGEAETLLI